MIDDEDVSFDPADSEVDDFADDDALSVLEAGIREQKRLNARLVTISLPEKLAWELVLRVPTSGGFIAGLGPHAKKRAKMHDIKPGTAFAALVLSRYTVGIKHGGKFAVDATADRASAFADPRLLKRLGAKDSVEAVLKLFDSEPVVAGLGEKFMEELSMDDAEVEESTVIEDPTALG